MASKSDDFPYTKLSTSIDKIRTRFRRLQEYKPYIVSKPYTITNLPDCPYLTLQEDAQADTKALQGSYILLTDPKAYHLYDGISTYFMEENGLIDGTFGKYPTLRNYWNENKQKIHDAAMKRYGEISPLTLRETLYFDKNVHEVGTFRPSNLVAVIKRYNPSRILDFSSGWGDRLIAALAMSVSYTGVDPHRKLMSGYTSIIETLRPDLQVAMKEKKGVTVLDAVDRKNKQLYRLIQAPFENADLTGSSFDMIFTSPPYFDYEKYSDEPDQSINRYPGYDAWFNDFLMVSIAKSWSYLVHGGYMIIVIDDKSRHSSGGEHPYTESMIAVVNTYADASFIGCLPYGNANKNGKYRPYPMWIWRKVDVITNLNPEIVVKKYNTKSGISINVVRDDLLPGGTKQRAVAGLPESLGYVISSASIGASQVAISVLGKIRQVPVHVFTTGLTNMSYRAKRYGAIYHLVRASYNVVRSDADKFAKQHGLYLVEFGCGTASYKENLYQALKSSTLGIPTPKRVWVTAGTCTLLSVLYRIFPESEFMVIQVGREVWKDLVRPAEKGKSNGTQIMIAPQKFVEAVPNDLLPPYPSIAEYDAKMWQFIEKFAKPDDLVWNVAG